MVDLTYCLINVLFFDIPLSYYYTNLNSSLICRLFSGSIYLFLVFLNHSHMSSKHVVKILLKYLLFYEKCFYQLNDQLLLLCFDLLFLKQFLLHLLQIFQYFQEVFDLKFLIYCLTFYQYFKQRSLGFCNTISFNY